MNFMFAVTCPAVWLHGMQHSLFRVPDKRFLRLKLLYTIKQKLPAIIVRSKTFTLSFGSANSSC
jgi:hypothetical protein